MPSIGDYTWLITRIVQNIVEKIQSKLLVYEKFVLNERTVLQDEIFYRKETVFNEMTTTLRKRYVDNIFKCDFL